MLPLSFVSILLLDMVLFLRFIFHRFIFLRLIFGEWVDDPKHLHRTVHPSAGIFHANDQNIPIDA